MTPSTKRPPFTRIQVSDLATAAFAVSDIYDKLNSVALSVNPAAVPVVPAADPAAAAAASSTQGTVPATDPANSRSGLTTITKSTQLAPADATVLASILTASSVILPNTRDYPSKPQWIKNGTDSVANLTFQSPTGQKVDDVAAGTISLAPGKAICIEATDSGWIILSRIP